MATPSITPEHQQFYLAALREGATHKRAAKDSGVSYSTWNRYRKSNPWFEEFIEEAIEEGSDELEEEATRRAVKGIDKPIVYKGEITGYTKEYSDTLLIFLLKARRPEKFRERQEVQHTGPDGLAERMAEGRRRLVRERTREREYLE